jgi:hypothetical protein
MQCINASGRNLTGERCAPDEDNHMGTIDVSMLIARTSPMVKTCISGV